MRNSAPVLRALPPALAVLDVGFYRHPDLSAGRVLACRDATRLRIPPFSYGDPRASAEHGTRTMLLAAGDGTGSGLVSASPRAPVVLLKVGHGPRAPRASIVRALAWLHRNADHFGIRVVLMPLGDDPEEPGRPSPVPGLVEALDGKGLVVVAAAGWNPRGDVSSPASSRYALGIGGFDIVEKTAWTGPRFGLIDGIPKPDFLAPAVPIPVPALDGGRSRHRAGGTSFAASLVSGLVLKLLARRPSWSRVEVTRRLLELSEPVPSQPPYLSPEVLGMQAPAGDEPAPADRTVRPPARSR